MSDYFHTLFKENSIYFECDQDSNDQENVERTLLDNAVFFLKKHVSSDQVDLVHGLMLEEIYRPNFWSDSMTAFSCCVTYAYSQETHWLDFNWTLGAASLGDYNMSLKVFLVLKKPFLQWCHNEPLIMDYKQIWECLRLSYNMMPEIVDEMAIDMTNAMSAKQCSCR